MPAVTITLDDELFLKLQVAAADTGVDIEDFLATAIHRHRAQLLPDAPKQWMPREQWDALVRSESCPMCAELQANEHINAYGYTIADLQVSRLRLGADQFMPGYCVLISKVHVSEVYHLDQEDQARYFEDLMHAARAIEQVFQPLKMNFELLGNALPHLHCHIKPRYYGDAAPGEPLHPDKGTRLLAPEEYEQRVGLIKEALENVYRKRKGDSV